MASVSQLKCPQCEDSQPSPVTPPSRPSHEVHLSPRLTQEAEDRGTRLGTVSLANLPQILVEVFLRLLQSGYLGEVVELCC